MIRLKEWQRFSSLGCSLLVIFYLVVKASQRKQA
jgi:hypothetical protein